MPKVEYDRYSLQRNMLKKVIIRVDLEGATNMDSIISCIKTSEVGANFNKYQKRIRHNVSVSVEGITAETTSLPVSDISSGPFHVFYEYNRSSDDVELSISNHYICLTVNCIDYKNIDPFRDLLSKVLDMILESDHFIIMKRLGIRKINGYETPADSMENKIFEVFESKAFESNIMDSSIANELEKNCRISYSETNDVFTVNIPNHTIEFIYKRMIRHVFDPQKRCYNRQAILDIDAHTSDPMSHLIKENSGDPFKSIVNEINELLFKLYRFTVTEKFLSENKMR